MAPGVTAIDADLLGADVLVAGGMFPFNSPNEGKLWLFTANPRLLRKSVAGGC